MKQSRRQFMITSTGVGTVLLAGCLSRSQVEGAENSGSGENGDGDGETWSPEVTVSEHSLQAGETTVLTVEITDTAGIQIQSDPDSDAIEFDFDETDLTPSPEFTYQMHPPFWRWDTRTSIKIKQPITVAAEAHPHEYTYKIQVLGDKPESSAIDLDKNESPGDELETLTKQFELTIIE